MISLDEKNDLEKIAATHEKCDAIVDYITSMSGNILPYDVRYIQGAYGDIDTSIYEDWINNVAEVRAALNVNSSPKVPIFQNGKTSAQALQYDTMYVNSLEYINYVAARLPTLIYEGNMDMQDGSTNAIHWLNLLAAPFGNGGITSVSIYDYLFVLSAI